MTDLHEELRAAARAHVPDRERMLARVERGMADAPPPPPGGRPSPGPASPSPLSPPARPWWSAPTPWRR